MKPYPHIFFDLDHTLWDFDRNSERALTLILNDLFGDNPPFSIAEFIHRYRTINARCWEMYRQGKMSKEVLRSRRFEETMACFGLNDPGTAAKMGEAYLELSPKQPLLVEGAGELLEHLKSQGRILHIITNGFSEVQGIKLKQSGLAPFFKEIIISEHIGFNKPDPRVFDFAMKKAGIGPEETLMVGDDLEADIIGARKAGMDQAFFNPDSKSHEEEVTYEIKQLIHLKDILLF